MFVDVGDLRIRYEVYSSGPAVLLLHGWGGALESMLPVAHCLSHAYGVFALDLPGFGQSSRPASAWGSKEYATLVGEFMDRIGQPHAHVVAHSFGGRIAIWLAAMQPERVRKLVLVDSAGIKPRPTLALRLKVGMAKVSKRLLQFMPVPPLRAMFLKQLDVLGSADYRRSGPMRGTLVRVVNEDLRTLLPSVKAPTLVIWGEEDKDVPVQYGEWMARAIPTARLEILPGAGHFSYIDRLPRFCHLVRDFLKDK